MPIDPIELSRELIAFNTINPPGNELGCIRHLKAILSGAGLETSIQNFAPDRANLIARIGGVGTKPPLCFTGHVDTVPLGNAPWSVDAFAGEIIVRPRHNRHEMRGSSLRCGHR
jgi:succinyl-diaminopimelate desuccinylase